MRDSGFSLESTCDKKVGSGWGKSAMSVRRKGKLIVQGLTGGKEKGRVLLIRLGEDSRIQVLGKSLGVDPADDGSEVIV
jgi:hypothetical protein